MELSDISAIIATFVFLVGSCVFILYILMTKRISKFIHPSENRARLRVECICAAFLSVGHSRVGVPNVRIALYDDRLVIVSYHPIGFSVINPCVFFVPLKSIQIFRKAKGWWFGSLYALEYTLPDPSKNSNLIISQCSQALADTLTALLNDIRKNTISG